MRIVAVLLVVLQALAMAQAVTKTSKIEIESNPTDVGLTVKVSCFIDTTAAGDDPDQWEIKKDNTPILTLGSLQSITFVAAMSDNKKELSCVGSKGGTLGQASQKEKLTVNALEKPTFTSEPPATGGKLTALLGGTIVFTCLKNAKNLDPLSYKLYEGSNELTTGLSGTKKNVYTLKLTAADDGKTFKCEHFNTNTAKKFSDTITVKVTETFVEGCTTKDGKFHTLTCKKTKATEDVVEWYIGSTKLPNTAVCGNKNDLKMFADKNDVSMYRCRFLDTKKEYSGALALAAIKETCPAISGAVHVCLTTVMGLLGLVLSAILKE